MLYLFERFQEQDEEDLDDIMNRLDETMDKVFQESEKIAELAYQASSEPRVANDPTPARVTESPPDTQAFESKIETTIAQQRIQESSGVFSDRLHEINSPSLPWNPHLHVLVPGEIIAAEYCAKLKL